MENTQADPLIPKIIFKTNNQFLIVTTPSPSHDIPTPQPRRMVVMRSLICFIFLFYAAVNNALASSCWHSAAERYGIHETILRAIALTESAMDPHAINRNTNGSVDVGLMQINSRWFPRLAEMGIQPGDLWDPCTNIHVGAWVLAGEIRRFGYTWRAIGAYNAGPGWSVAHEQKRRAYAQRVFHNLADYHRHFGDGMRIHARTQQ